MQRQHRETESKIFQTGFNRSRMDWRKEQSGSSNSAGGEAIAKNASSKGSTETLEEIWRETLFIETRVLVVAACTGTFLSEHTGTC